MFNKFKIGDNVLIIGIGKCNNKTYFKCKGKIICKDPYYKDYNVKLEDGSEDWLDAQYLIKVKEKKMKILNVKTKGFRAFEDTFETKLYDITNITGANRKGKTNILHAIVWGFLGTSISGDDKVWLGNKNSDGCYVEIEFIDNSKNIHTLIRYKDKYSTKKSFISLDNKVVKQEDLLNYYMDKKLFLSIINQSYFISKSPTEQKALIDKYLPELDIKEVFDKLDDKEKELLGTAPSNINLLIEDLNDEKKYLENKIKNLQGKIEYANQIIDQKVEDKKVFDTEKEEELTLSLQELSYIRSNDDSNEKKEIEEKIKRLQENERQVSKKIDSIQHKFLQERQKFIAIRDSEDEICPTCLQKLDNNSKANTLENMKESLINLHTERIKLEGEQKDINFNINAEICKYNIICRSNPMDTIKRMHELDEQIKSLESQKSEILQFNSMIDAKLEQINQAKSDVSNFQTEISNTRKQLDLNKESKKVAQKLYINYIEQKMKFANKHLKNVSIRFYSTLKETGEIKEDFIITYNKNELKNLSRSESIATSIELANMFNKISGANIPLFIDDSESCQDYNFVQDYYSNDTQIIVAKVCKGEELKICDNSNNIANADDNLEEMQKVA